MSTVEPVRKQIVIATSQEQAFRIFTNKIERWWPKEHHIGKSPMKEATLEPKVGGRWYEIGEDGSECDWGKVLVWNPHSRLVLAWQISGQWQYDASLITEVEVTFTAEGPKQTRVVLEHRNLERFGAAAAEIRKALDSDGGWTQHLHRLAAVAEGRA
jgi:uncharacterized protein YndB with AHSA1/START domain